MLFPLMNDKQGPVREKPGGTTWSIRVKAQNQNNCTLNDLFKLKKQQQQLRLGPVFFFK